MPFGDKNQFKDWDACIEAIMKSGKSREEASRICGAIKRDTETIQSEGMREVDLEECC